MRLIVFLGSIGVPLFWETATYSNLQFPRYEGHAGLLVSMAYHDVLPSTSSFGDRLELLRSRGDRIWSCT